jgi:acyl transferase domain-containing protein/NADPH:quinone reductase-like Zn-dependent oxidoreductase/acyl carrier protein
MACRFPGEADSPDAYWDVLKNGKDVVTEVSSERWGTNFYQHPDKKEPGKSYTFAAGVLPQVDEFDAGFFGISPREAAQMDPQQRLLLELTWEALEDGHQVPELLAGSDCAVYIGIASTDYAHRRMDDLSSLDPYSMTGNTASIASNRISYVFDLHGPSVSVDTACSSSLVALHQACNAIWNGDAPTAITGGVNMLLHPFGFVGFSKASMLSPSGRCRAFDASGDGYVRSEGSAILYLKPLEDAERDGDPIHAVIINTGINSDGRTNGITLPSTEGQAGLLKRVYENAGIKPDDLDYLEAHGTGTAVGDPLEAGALAKVLGRPRKNPLPIGSAKTNLGHLETASGMAGFLKVVLSLKNRAIPPSLHFNEPNPNIDFEGDKLSVVTDFTPLKESEKPLLMGVNSFGFGGANAHVVVEEYKPNIDVTFSASVDDEIKQSNPISSPLFLSADSTSALRAMAGQYRDFLQQDDVRYADVAWTSYSKRQQLSHGLAVHGEELHDIVECLHAYSLGEIHTGVAAANKLNTSIKSTKLALVFSGNGSQWQGMGCELLKSEPLFKETVEDINTLLNVYDELSLVDEFNATPEESRLHLTEVAQPLLFALQVGVMRVLESKGLKANAVIGHSVGEVAAAWASGVLSLEDAVRVIYQRSHAQGKTKGAGRMAAAGISNDDIKPILNELSLESDVSIAGINSPKSITLSGTLKSLEILAKYFEERGIFYRILDLDYAFHSPAMDPVEKEIKQSLKGLNLSNTSRTFYSTVTGNVLAGEALGADYWWDNIRQPVLFGSAMENLLDDGYQVFLEIGPHPVLRTYVNECSREKELIATALPTIKRQGESKTALLNALYDCYLAGCPLDDNCVFPEKANTVRLPAYPWQREKHWYTLTAEGLDLVNRHREHPLLGYRLKDYDASWENQVDTNLLSYLGDHVVDGGAIFPAAAYVEMALAASEAWFGHESDDEKKKQWEIENIEIRAPIVLDHSKIIRFKLFTKDGSFIISSRDRLSDNPWVENVVGRLLGNTSRKKPERIAFESIIKKAEKTITSAGHYQLTESVGLSYGATFQGVDTVWVSSLSALAKLTIPNELLESSDNQDLSQYQLHPALLDAGFQILVDVFADKIEQGSQAALIPVQLGKLYRYSDMNDLSYISVNIIKQSPQSVLAHYLLLDSKGLVLAELKNCRFRGVQLTRGSSMLPASYEFKPLLMPHLESGKLSPISEPAALVSHALAFLNSHEKEFLRSRHYQEVLPLFDVMVSVFAWQAIHQLNPKGDEFTLKSLSEQAHIESIKLPLLSRLLGILVDDELAGFKNGQWLLVPECDLPPAEDIWLSVLGDSPAYLPELMLLGRCGKHLADVLQHKIIPESLLYSQKSSIQEHWNGASPSNISMNLALRDTLREIVEDWPENQRLRVLEVGASDTEISQLILSVFTPEQCDYDYIHHDEELLVKATFDLEPWSFVKTQQLDLSLDIEINDDIIQFGIYDIVIAANTLYHSDDLPKVQKNIKNLLSPKGVLLLLERQSDRFMDMTFGLQSDWWIHTSDNQKPIPLLMSAGEWRTALKETGFDQVELLLEPEATADTGAFMVVANHSDKFVVPEIILANSDVISQHEVNPQTWMILKDESEVSNCLANSLNATLVKLGHQIITVQSGETYKRLGPTHFSINFDSEKSTKEEHFDHIIETLNKLDLQCDHIIHLMGFRWHSDVNNGVTDQGDLSIQNQRCTSTVDLIKALEVVNGSKLPQLSLITSGGAVVAREEQIFPFESSPSQAALWGLGRVIMNEHPDLNCKLIDLQGVFNPDATSRLFVDELLKEQTTIENEVVLNGDVRHVMRMHRVTLEQVSKQPINKNSLNIPYCLRFSTPGQLKNLYWQELPEQFLQADEIEIKPHATGLNFRDVMYAMGLLSDEAVENGFAGPTLGMELSGTVVNKGSAVSEFKVGDEVLGFAPACFSSRVITQTTAITHKPESWSFEEAATVPTTFFTVYYALKHLAQIQPGEKILIHGAAGGVGIAAIQFARFCGAEIFATAGSDEKRDFVRLMGADHVMDSRSLAFADDVMQITNGEGVDIVLNSLAGEAITRNLAILKPFGRFLELGKRDFYENSKIGLRPFRNNISYFGIDADQLLIERPELANRLFKEMMAQFDEGSLRPMPYRSFPATRIQDAFRYMQQSRQVGKVIVSFMNGNAVPIEEIQTLKKEEAELHCDSNASYLVTGGLSGFGLKTACWLVEKGARSLVLISRSASIGNESQLIIDDLTNKGVEVYTRACDVTDKTALRLLILEIHRDNISPLKGIVHAAMVLEDGLIRNMTQSQILNVMSPKITGAWNLHEATLETDLDFFVLYSSATTFVGNPGQANYVAANSFLESLATYRKSKGLPAHYAAWGAIADVGYLARNEETKEQLQSRLGGEALNSNQALMMLEKIMLSDKAGAAIIDLDWGVIQRVMPAASSAKYEELKRQVKSSDGDQYEDIQTLIANMGHAEVQALVTDLLLDEVEQILRLPRDKMDIEQSIFDLGMDSLMGMELVLAIEERFGVKLPVMALTEGANIQRIAERITDQLSGTDVEDETQNGTGDTTSSLEVEHHDDISIAASRHGHTDKLSQDEAEELSKKLIEDAMNASK